jgi:hypothetical protein
MSTFTAVLFGSSRLPVTRHQLHIVDAVRGADAGTDVDCFEDGLACRHEAR